MLKPKRGKAVPYRPGQVYAVPCGPNEYFLAQVAADKGLSLGIFNEVIEAANEKEIQEQAEQYLNDATLFRRVYVIYNAPRRGGWLNAGKHPIHPALQQEYFRAHHQLTGCDEKNPPIVSYSIYSDSIPYGRPASKEEVESLEYDIQDFGTIFLFWLEKTLPHVDGYEKRFSNIQSILQRLWDDPVSRRRLQFVMPGYLESQLNEYGVNPQSD